MPIYVPCVVSGLAFFVYDYVNDNDNDYNYVYL